MFKFTFSKLDAAFEFERSEILKLDPELSFSDSMSDLMRRFHDSGSNSGLGDVVALPPDFALGLILILELLTGESTELVDGEVN